MDNIRFNSLQELYERLTPALETKVNEFKMNGIKYISEKDIWEYLKINKWSKGNDLTLAECVDDILNTSDIEFKKYIKSKLSNKLGGVK